MATQHMQKGEMSAFDRDTCMHLHLLHTLLWTFPLSLHPGRASFKAQPSSLASPVRLSVELKKFNNPPQGQISFLTPRSAQITPRDHQGLVHVHHVPQPHPCVRVRGDDPLCPHPLGPGGDGFGSFVGVN
jgi:hypothetical protein